jgi:hypothetical protein
VRPTTCSSGEWTLRSSAPSCANFERCRNCGVVLFCSVASSLSSKCGTAASTEPNLTCPRDLGRVLARIESLRDNVAKLLRFVADGGGRLGMLEESDGVTSRLCPRLCFRVGDCSSGCWATSLLVLPAGRKAKSLCDLPLRCEEGESGRVFGATVERALRLSGRVKPLRHSSSCVFFGEVFPSILLGRTTLRTGLGVV